MIDRITKSYIKKEGVTFCETLLFNSIANR